MKCNIYIFTFCLSLLGFSLSLAGESIVLDKEFSRSIVEDFDISSGGLISINNRYGDVDVESSSRSSVHFEITIIVEARDQERANEIMDKIDIDFSDSSTKVSAKTSIGETNWKWKGNEKYEINYKVLVPVNSPLIIENKYGDVSLSDMESDVELTLKYGNGYIQNVGGDLTMAMGYVKSFSAGDVGGEIQLEAAYSELKISSSPVMEVNSKYSDIRIEKAGKLDIQSSYDDYILGMVDELTNRGKYDDFVIDRVEIVDVETKYSGFRIKKLGNKGKFNTGYGKVNIEGVAESFSALTIDGRYTGYDLSVDHAFNLEISTKYTGVKYPDEMSFSERIKDSNELSLKGFYRSSGKSRIVADMKYGHLRINY